MSGVSCESAEEETYVVVTSKDEDQRRRMNGPNGVEDLSPLAIALLNAHVPDCEANVSILGSTESAERTHRE